ncbi:MAG: L,D-transpeptidase family protein [Bacteroidales bacterium]|nr:L,D-transpeptidase family protein [Bacteroidales bacterium]
MKFRRRTKILLIIILILILAGGGFITLFFLSANPPVETIDRCSQVLSKARQAEAGEYVRDLLSEAENGWREAMVEWKIQNTKWYINRDYTLLHEKIQLTIRKGEAAYRRSITVKDSMHHDLAVILTEVGNKLKHYADRYGLLPLNQQSRQDYRTAEMLYLEAKAAYERGNYNRVVPKLEKSRKLIGESIRKNQVILRDYFTNIPKWKRWVDETINWSRVNDKPVIIIDKFARKCYVYARGVQIFTLDAEFGINWIGEKKRVGDKATPEGRYSVTKKKSNKRTNYYKALLIDYPNEEDKARFAEEVRRGLISWRTSIGGMIEIHGGGGKGINWTNGCVAVKNEDMDQVYQYAEVGTPVTIVGSLKSMNEVQRANR